MISIGIFYTVLCTGTQNMAPTLTYFQGLKFCIYYLYSNPLEPIFYPNPLIGAGLPGALSRNGNSNPINLYLLIRYNRIINNIRLFPNSPKYPVSDHNISKKD